MSSPNTALWDNLGRTDPAHTQQFKRGGGFKGTAIKPIWSFRRMTEEFGPCGLGWGVGEPSFQVVPGDNREVLVYCTASIWYRDPEGTDICTVYGVGGDKVVSYIRANEQYNRPERWESDDEAFKKAFTDAITNALKLIGVGADVHMGRFDDNKYVSEMRQEFAEETTRSEPPRKANGLPEKGYREDGTRTSYALKTEQPELWAEFQRELAECQTLVSLERFKKEWRLKASKEKWNPTYLATAKDQIEGRENAIAEEAERLSLASPDELAELPVQIALEHSLRNNPLRAG